MLDEVLGEDEVDVLERQAEGHVEDAIDAGERLVVDVDPAVEVLAAGAEMEFHVYPEPQAQDLEPTKRKWAPDPASPSGPQDKLSVPSEVRPPRHRIS